ncbi:MAG: hypothetical protein VB070_07190 [Clostridiaceae bacterium]|nr:hypothetical protein [Clostridiaceae bacterium]
MAQIDLSCPHCGGHFSLDSSRPLQAYWTCPYCNNRSLMQRDNEQIRLRGIIANRAGQENTIEPAAVPPESPVINEENRPAKPRSLSDFIAETNAPPEPVQPAGEPETIPSEQESPADDYFELAKAAAQERRLPAFNSYCRQAIDKNPEDPRPYVWRARLTEEAGGFARSTWATPTWYLLTPKQKTATLAQHFYAFNAAMQFSSREDQKALVEEIGRHIVRQLVEHVTERAEIRCQRHWFKKTFQGRYRHADLNEIGDFTDAISRIDEQACPFGSLWLRREIADDTAVLPRQLARRLRRL